MVKTSKVLIMFYKLWQGERLNKKRFMNEFKIGERSFERYLQEIRNLLADCYSSKELCFDKQTKTYYISDIIRTQLKGSDILPLLFMLLGSRAFVKKEVKEILTRWLLLLPQSERRTIEPIVKTMNQKYIEPDHKKLLLKIIWDLSYCIRNRRKIDLHYDSDEGTEKHIKVQPMQIVFANSYFYLISLEESNIEPKFYRLDKINSFDMLEAVASRKDYQFFC